MLTFLANTLAHVNDARHSGALIAGSDDAQAVPTVHVLDLPPQLNSDLLRCYEDQHGAAPWDDTKPHGQCGGGEVVCGAHLATETAQYSADVLLHAAMSRRARDSPVGADAADVIWLPYYNMLSILVRECGGLNHTQRLDLLRERIAAVPRLLSRKGRLALALPFWNIAAALGHRDDGHSAASQALERTVAAHGVHVLLTDPLFMDIGKPFRVRGWMAAAYDSCRTVRQPASLVLLQPALNLLPSSPLSLLPAPILCSLRARRIDSPSLRCRPCFPTSRCSRCNVPQPLTRTRGGPPRGRRSSTFAATRSSRAAASSRSAALRTASTGATLGRCLATARCVRASSPPPTPPRRAARMTSTCLA